MARLARRNPQQLTTMLNAQGDFGFNVANFGLRNGDTTLFNRALASRKEPQLWVNFYRAMAGVYFGDAAAQVETAFRAILGPETIGERLAKRPDENANATGDQWFYVAARLGEYRTELKLTTAEDYLAAIVERNPAIGNSHLELANFYRDHAQLPKALESYDRALEWNAALVEAKLGVASVYAAQGKADDVVRVLTEVIASGNVDMLKNVLNVAAKANVLERLKEPIEKMMTTERIFDSLITFRLWYTASLLFFFVFPFFLGFSFFF